MAGCQAKSENSLSIPSYLSRSDCFWTGSYMVVGNPITFRVWHDRSVISRKVWSLVVGCLPSPPVTLTPPPPERESMCFNVTFDIQAISNTTQPLICSLCCRFSSELHACKMDSAHLKCMIYQSCVKVLFIRVKSVTKIKDYCMLARYVGGGGRSRYSSWGLTATDVGFHWQKGLDPYIYLRSKTIWIYPLQLVQV